MELGEGRQKPLRTVAQKIYFILAWFFLAIGALGAFLPLLPTTPFVLLAAWLLAKSSERYYQWLRRNRLFGKSVRCWEAGLGLTVSEKVRMIVVVTIVFGVSFFLCTNTVGRIVLVCCWPIPIGIALFSKTRDPSRPIPEP
jgi:uncharacterized membrane protein YbaN (DUF454 family)